MAAGVLMLLLSGILEFSRHYYARLTVRHHVAEAARYASTGQNLVDMGSGEPMTRAESVVFKIRTASDSLPVTLESVVLDPADGGAPGDIVRINATFRFTFLSSALVRLFAPESLAFTVAAVVKNEPRF